MTTKHICIIGGYGGMGQMTAKMLASLPEYKITLFGENDWENPRAKLRDQDIVLISVPIECTETIIAKTAPLLDQGTILADYTSIKQAPMNTMLKHYEGTVLGLHPIFGPSIDSADKQVIVYCEGRHPAYYQWFLDDLSKLGFTLEQMTAKAHDDAMAFIQGIEHFTVYCVGQFLEHKQVDIQQLRRIASPVYRMELNIIGRLFSQDPKLYADIIMSDPKREALIGEYATFIQNQANAVMANDKTHFVERFNQVKHWMGNFADKAYQESDKMLGVTKKDHE
jgi:prephenate dehydrogenase